MTQKTEIVHCSRAVRELVNDLLPIYTYLEAIYIDFRVKLGKLLLLSTLQ